MPSKPLPETPTEHPDPVVLAAVLAVENVSIGMFAAMMALLRAGGRMRLMKLSLHVGQSYWAVRNHVRRTPYFTYEARPSEKLVVTLTEEGAEKYRRIQHRISRTTAASA